MQRFKVELGQRYGFHPEITPFTSFIKEFIEKLKQLDNKEKSGSRVFCLYMEYRTFKKTPQNIEN